MGGVLEDDEMRACERGRERRQWLTVSVSISPLFSLPALCNSAKADSINKYLRHKLNIQAKMRMHG